MSKRRLKEEEKLESVKKRFEKHVVRNDGCWDWKGCIHHSGYLPFNYYGSINSYAHIVSWKIHFGEIPKGMCVCHKCDNKKCTNPEHLFLGTQKENVDDMYSKNRGQTGTKHHKAKLDDEKVKEIKKLLLLGVTMTRIAKDYGVSCGTIFFIKEEKIWKHIK